ncbi:MAG: hypothetical protein HON14_00640 [Rhodospirillaceae bacterium]|jgi:hypothetical protein|nr:hypothetical protein [Rhodospirillaceae bacterium]MBT4590244.1 hypothetical protein [Rhodospirillaceae bacterium]MBT4937608.1 hypothetical protein [Rhodospirillaceae bacterium]MBT7267511.1 hypothetical protein [Rhodospirillaceae bacterium]
MKNNNKTISWFNPALKSLAEGDRQLSDPRFGLIHNLGGYPHQNISSVSIVGHYGE